MLPGGSGHPLTTLRRDCRRFKRQLRRRPPGQSKILVILQGFSELLGRPWVQAGMRRPRHSSPLACAAAERRSQLHALVGRPLTNASTYDPFRG